MKPMTSPTLVRRLLFCCLFLALPGAAWGELSFAPSWELRAYGDVRSQLIEWLETSGADRSSQSQVRALWPEVQLRETRAAELLDRLAESFALVDPRASALVDACNRPIDSPLPPEANWLSDSSLPIFFRNNLQLYYARWLAQHQRYDEVLTVLEELQLTEVIDPASLLFYRLVAYQQLVLPEECRAELTLLLEQQDALPRRYLQIAQLVQRDLAGLKDESLDHISRRMNDVRRRLDIGRAGKQVQLVEQSVLDSLDKLIDEAEKQQQQQQQCMAPGSAQGSKPMQDSRPAELKAPGRVDPRDIGGRSGWGDLPPKQREQALQQIGREYPAYYRELIEQYFRELADQSTAEPQP